MSEDLNKKIQQIADVLGSDSMPDNIKDLLSVLAGSLGSKKPEETTAKQTEAPPPSREERSSHSEGEDSGDMLRRVKKVMDKVSINNDPRINLLNAIQPFMNPHRQKKIGNCIRLLQMTSLTRLLDDNDK